MWAHHFERLFAAYGSYVLLVILTKNQGPIFFVHLFQYELSHFNDPRMNLVASDTALNK